MRSVTKKLPKFLSRLNEMSGGRENMCLVVRLRRRHFIQQRRTSSTSSSKEELNLFINSVNSFHPALKYTWEISENSLAFLDIKLSINDNGLSTSVHYKPTDSHNYLLHSSSHPQHVKNAIPFSQFLRLRRLCSDNTDFNNK